MSHVLLVVANDDAMLELVHLVLRYNGYTVFVVRTPSDAAEIAAHHKIDLVVADQRLPAVGRRDVFQQLKAIDVLARIPVMMVAGIGVDRAGRLTQNDNLHPIPLRNFVDEVAKFFSRNQRAVPVGPTGPIPRRRAAGRKPAAVPAG